ncbi:hypothetical protein AgCh_027826 [Apium graveolens]
MARCDEEGIQNYFEEKKKLEEILVHEELYWKQRAKVFWLTEEDTISKFIHATASKRKKANHISHLLPSEDEVVDKHEEISVKQMHPDKSARPDGLSPAFFQDLWQLLEEEIYNCYRDQLHQTSTAHERNLGIIYRRIVKLRNVLGLNVYLLKYEKRCAGYAAQQLRGLAKLKV